MTTLTVERVTELPRVNLLPPEIAAAARFRRLKMMLALALVGVLVVVGLLFVWASGKVSSAQSELDTAQAANTALQAEAAQYAEVPRVLAEVAAAEANLATAMAPEVRWSFYLNDLSLVIPDTVRLSGMTISETVSTGALGTTGIGTVEFSGKATSYNAVAAWLQAIAKQEGYSDTYVSGVTKDDGDTVGKVYTFTSQVVVTEEALSNRYAPKVGP